MKFCTKFQIFHEMKTIQRYLKYNPGGTRVNNVSYKNPNCRDYVLVQHMDSLASSKHSKVYL